MRPVFLPTAKPRHRFHPAILLALAFIQGAVFCLCTPSAQAQAPNLDGRWGLSGQLEWASGGSDQRLADDHDWSVEGALSAVRYLTPRFALGGYGGVGHRRYRGGGSDVAVTEGTIGLTAHIGFPTGKNMRVLLVPFVGYSWARAQPRGDVATLEDLETLLPVDAIDTVPAGAASTLSSVQLGVAPLWGWRLSQSLELAMGPTLWLEVPVNDTSADGPFPARTEPVASGAGFQARLLYFTDGEPAERHEQQAPTRPFALRGDWQLSGRIDVSRWPEGSERFTPARGERRYSVGIQPGLQRFVRDWLAVGGFVHLGMDAGGPHARWEEARTVGGGALVSFQSPAIERVGMGLRTSVGYRWEKAASAAGVTSGHRLDVGLQPVLLVRLAGRLALTVGPQLRVGTYVTARQHRSTNVQLKYGLSSGLVGTF